MQVEYQERDHIVLLVITYLEARQCRHTPSVSFTHTHTHSVYQPTQLSLHTKMPLIARGVRPPTAAMAGVLVAALVLLAATAARSVVADVVFKRRMVVVRDSRIGGGPPPPPPIAPVRPVSIKPNFAATGTDKLSRHGYHRFYDQFLQPLYGKAVRMVEVGVLGGDPLRPWQTVFDAGRSIIYGVSWPETEAVKDQLGPNVHVVYRDQSNCAHHRDRQELGEKRGNETGI